MTRHAEAGVVFRRLAEQRAGRCPVTWGPSVEEHHRSEAAKVDLLQPLRQVFGLLLGNRKVALCRLPFAGRGGGNARGSSDETGSGPEPDCSGSEELGHEGIERRDLLPCTQDGEAT